MIGEKVLVLQSGGMDSAVVLAWAKKEYNEVHTLTIDYGQSHIIELVHADQLQDFFKIPYEHRHEVDLPLSGVVGKAAILNPLRKYNPDVNSVPESNKEISPAWVPARNAIFLSAAAGKAHTLGIRHIATGVNCVDWSGYPDCTPKFIYFLTTALQYGLNDPTFHIWTPLINMSKKEIVLKGEELDVPWELTWSCYQGSLRPCGECPACKVRDLGFEQAGVVDPLTHVEQHEVLPEQEDLD